jgi:apolipoprotein N-acyltransferase
MAQNRILTQRSISAGLSCLLFVIQCVVIICIVGVATLQFQAAGAIIVISLAYLITTAICALVIFLPILLILKGRSHRFSVIYAFAGFATGFLSTLILFGWFVLFVANDRNAALIALMTFAFFNAAGGVASGLLTRYWLRKRLKDSLQDSAELLRIYS